MLYAQVAVGEELESIKASVALMKRMCRLQSQVVWKEWRCSVKEQHGRRLQAKLDTLQVRLMHHLVLRTLVMMRRVRTLWPTWRCIHRLTVPTIEQLWSSCRASQRPSAPLALPSPHSAPLDSKPTR